MAKAHITQSKRRTFLLLIEYTSSLAQLKNINEDWVVSILNHYLQCPSYLDKKLIPFYIEGFDEVFERIMNRELFGALKDIYAESIPYNTTKLTYPFLYIHIPQLTKSNIRIIKFDKTRPVKLRNSFEKILHGFNAQYIYLLDINGLQYKIFDYDFKHRLMCYSIKYDFIEKFNQANGLDELKSVVVFDKIDEKLNGIIVEQVVESNEVTGFFDRRLIIN